jgi:hypothetical protein
MAVSFRDGASFEGGRMTEFLGKGLIWFFTAVPGIGNGMAFVIAVGLVAFAFGVIVYYQRFHHKPLLTAVKARNEIIENIIGRTVAKSERARELFASDYFTINDAMLDDPNEDAPDLRR